MNYPHSLRPSGRSRTLAETCAWVVALLLATTFASAAPSLNWSTTVDTGASTADRTRAIGMMTNGDVIAASQIGSATDAQIRVQRLAGGTGVAAWTRDVGTASFAEDVADMVIDPATGDAYIAARAATASNGLDWLIFKVNGADGTLGWGASYTFSSTGNDEPRAICRTSDGNIAVAGMETNVGSGASRFRVTKLNAGTGAQMWSDASAVNGSDAMDVIGDASGNVIAVGRSGADAHVAKYASGGGPPTWTQTLNGSGNGIDIWNAVALLTGGDIVVAGSLVESSGAGNFAAARYPSAGGAATWTRTINGAANLDESAFDVTSDGTDVYAAGFLRNAGGQMPHIAKLTGVAPGTVTWSASRNGSSVVFEATDAFFSVRVLGTDVLAAGTQADTANKANLLITRYTTAGVFQEDTVFNGAANNNDMLLSKNLLASNSAVLAVGGDTENATPSSDGIVRSYTLAATAAEIAVEQPAGNDLTDGSASVSFGSVNVADTLPLTFTIKNTDLSTSLSVGAITFDGANAGDFSVTTPPAASVAASGSTTFVVTFKPLNDGARAAAMHIVNGDSSENPFDIALTGTGKPVIGGTWTPGTPILDLPGPFDATDLTIDTDLGFVPTPGVPVVFVHADGGITGQFNDLPDGGVVAMAINGVIYYFTVDYGPNDITLTNFTPSGPAAWRWAGGPNTRNNAASFGVFNTPAGSNNPGARQGAMNWRGVDGSLWMFGGYGYASAVTNPPKGLNDLWQYNRTLGQWIWRSGSTTHSAAGVYGSITVEAAGNTPGARHTGTTWTDDSGNLWLFGGVSGTLRNNDLWRYNRTTGLWAWMKGANTTGQAGTYGVLGTPAAANTPGARQGATGWFTSDGNLWLFGGFTGAAYHNDLWRYNLASGNWTWMSGGNTTNINGTYGVQGTPAPANFPGGRRDGTGWVAADGSLWLFGGQGLSSSGVTIGDMNDLWRFNRGTGQWTWIKGSNALAGAATYGVQGTPAPANTPGARSAGSGWATVDGKFWLIGGFQNSASSFSDVWIYDSVTNLWVWMLGDNTLDATGTYGSLGVPAPGNKPGARFTPSTWVTLNGTLWIFGGGGVDAFGTTGRLSDLWSYSIPPPAGVPFWPAPEPFPSEFIVNEDPETSDASAGTLAYVPVAGQLTGTDADRDIILFNSVGSTQSQGTLTLKLNGQWTYTPAPGFVGQATFNFKASDYYGGESPVRSLVITVVTNPADSDNDGIADTYEQNLLGGTGADALGDADLDGQSNYFEYLAGTNPVDAAQSLSTAPSVSAGASTNGGSFKIDLNHVRPGVSYHLETSSDLDIWSRIGTFTFNVAGSATIEDPTPPTGQPQFYRVSLEANTLLP